MRNFFLHLASLLNSFPQMFQETHPDILPIRQPARGNEGENEQQVVKEGELKQIISFSVAIITMASPILLQFLNGAKDIRAMHSSTVIKAYNFLIWSTLQSPILLLMYAFFLLGRYNIPINRNQKMYLIGGITISCVLLIVASFFSILLLSKDSAGICVIVIPVIAIICFLGYRAEQNVPAQNVPDGDNTVEHERYKPQQKKAFKFAATISTMAITVQTGMIYASFESPPLQALQSFQIALSLFFVIAVVGIFVMLVTSLPLTVHYSFWSGSLNLRIVRYSNTAILALLGLSTAALAMQFLETFVVGIYLLVLVPFYVLYFAQEHCGRTDPTSTARPNIYEFDPGYAGARKGIARLVWFHCGLLAAICVASVGIQPQQYYMSLGIRVCAFFHLLAIESGLIWIGLTFEPQHSSETWDRIVKIFYYVSLLLQLVMIMAGPVMLFMVLS